MQTVLLYLQLEALERPEGLPVTYLDVHRRGSLSSPGQRPNIRKVPCLRASSYLRSVRPLVLPERVPPVTLAKDASGGPWRGPHVLCVGPGWGYGALAGDGAGNGAGDGA